METITTGIGSVVSLVGQVWNMVQSNDLLLVVACCGVVTAGIGVYRRLKRAVR